MGVTATAAAVAKLLGIYDTMQRHRPGSAMLDGTAPSSTAGSSDRATSSST